MFNWLVKSVLNASDEISLASIKIFFILSTSPLRKRIFILRSFFTPVDAYNVSYTTHDLTRLQRFGA